MRHFAWIIPLVLLLTSAVLADTPAEPVPWPPAPETLFAEGLKWSLVETPVYPVEKDYDRNRIRVLDAETNTWREFPSPLPDRSVYADLRADGHIAIWPFDEYGHDPKPGQLFLLDPATGLYTEPPTVCEEKVIQAEAGKGKWVIAYHDEKETAAFLCQSETGEQREVLPISDDIIEWRVFPNPTGTHLVVIAQNYGELFDVYAYSFADDTLISLGQSEHGLEIYLSVCDWLSDTQGLLCSSGMQSWMGVRWQVFDITQPNSVSYVSYGWGEDVIRLTDPVRYVSADVDEYDSSKFGTAPGGSPCTVLVYDATGPREADIAGGCVPILIDSYTIAPDYRQGESLYFLAKTGLEATVSTITRYDMQQETITPIGPYAAEIENIINVSPDGRYIVVLMDENNALDFPWQGYREGCCPEQYGWFVAIVDAETDNIIYLSEPMGVYTSHDAQWSDNDTLVIASEEIYRYIRASEKEGGIFIAPPATLRQIHLDDTGNVTTRSTTTGEDDWVALSPFNHGYGLRAGTALFDLKAFEVVPLFQAEALARYSLNAHWMDDGILYVSVSTLDDKHSTSYEITLPGYTPDEEDAR